MSDCSDFYTWADSSKYEWVDNSLTAWGVCDALSVYQLWMDEDYIYYITPSGLNVMETSYGAKVAYINYDGGFSSIWGNNQKIYLGTFDSGIKYLSKLLIIGNEAAPTSLDLCLVDYSYLYNASSPNIRYLHGNATSLVVVTDVGIDVINDGPNSFKSYFYSEDVNKAYITENNNVYYTTSSGLFRKNSSLSDWELPDVSYIAGNSFIPANVVLNDFYITINTSVSGNNNTLFVATTSGVYVFDEESELYEIYDASFLNTSCDIISISAEFNSSLNNGKLFTASKGVDAAVSTIDLKNKSIIEQYTLTTKGSADEYLDSEDVKDLIVGNI